MHELPITALQRSRLLDFVERANRTYGDGGFDGTAPLDDIRLVLLALMSAQLIGVADCDLTTFFAREFGLGDIDEDALAKVLSSVMLTSVEDQVRCAAGGRN